MNEIISLSFVAAMFTAWIFVTRALHRRGGSLGPRPVESPEPETVEVVLVGPETVAHEIGPEPVEADHTDPPIMELPGSPMRKHGLLWAGVFNDVLFADQWATRANGVEAYLVDHGDRVNLVLITEADRVGHTFPTMDMAARAAAYLVLNAH